MRANRIRIKEFRSLREFNLELDETTVFIGENNSGKTSVLDALRLTMSHRWGLRGTGFQEYDFHLSKDQKDPKHCPRIRIEIDFEEAVRGDWHEDIVADLQSLHALQIIDADRNRVTVRAEFAYGEETELFEPTWCFVNADGMPVNTPKARATNLMTFFNYVPVFSLSALRDADYEFSNKSQFWGNLIKSIKVDDEKWEEISKRLEALNQELLKANPKFASIKGEIEKLKSVMPFGSVDAIDLRALPLRVWDLIAKTELILRSSADDPWLPLGHFGQGVQSLAIINVFRAYVSNLLADEFEKHSSPILLLEEPETHLHPQAVRALYKELDSIAGQKIITTHSPYFLQHVPFDRIRLLRKVAGATKPFFVRREIREKLDINDALKKVVAKHGNIFSLDNGTGEIVVKSRIGQDACRDLLACYTTPQQRQAMQQRIADLCERSLDHIGKDELMRLEDSAKRIRGEIFFARKWILTEGQGDYILLNAMAPLVIGDLDSHAVAVIDCQNNGPAGAFASLARTFGFPWAVLCDGDKGGADFVKNLKAQGFSEAYLNSIVTQFPNGTESEHALTAKLPQELLDELLRRIGASPDAGKSSPADKAVALQKAKIMTSLTICEMIAEQKINKQHVPAEIIKVLEYIKTATTYR